MHVERYYFHKIRMQRRLPSAQLRARAEWLPREHVAYVYIMRGHRGLIFQPYLSTVRWERLPSAAFLIQAVL